MDFINLNTSMKYTVVSTFNADGYQKYGRRMISTFISTWPKEVDLVIYAEKCAVTETAPNLTVLDLESASPELVAFKNKWHNVPKANGDISELTGINDRKDNKKAFKWQAVRFSHKVYSIFHAAKNIDADWLIWMDADMVCHSSMSLDFLASKMPKDKDLCYLGRGGKYSECGLYAMQLKTPATQEFLTEFQRMYDDAENGIFTLKEWHDSFVFDSVRRKTLMQQLDWSAYLVVGEGHPLINCDWGGYLDHLKGSRKDAGRSKAKDLIVKRTETYWR
jgi:hypothetical protein